MSEVLPKVFADLWTRHLPPKKITVRFWRFLKHILLSSLLNPSGNFAPVLMASSLLPRPVHGAVYKWTPNKHFLRLQESLQKKTTKNNKETKPALKEDHLNNQFPTSPCALGIHMFSPRPSCGPFALEDPDLRPWQRPSNREAKWSRFKLAEVCINTSSSRCRKRLPRTFKNNSLQFNNSIQLNGVLSLFPLTWHAHTCTHNANSNCSMGFTNLEIHKMLRGSL